MPVYFRDVTQKRIRRLHPAALGKERTMAIPMFKQQDIRRLDRQGVSRSEIREEAGRGPRHCREIRRHGRHDAETAAAATSPREKRIAFPLYAHRL